jgi:hypothetical protein
MKTIKAILDGLQAQDRKKLMYAFENGFAQHVEYEPGKYVGVNTANIKHLSKRQAAGSWYEGDIQKGDNNEQA